MMTSIMCSDSISSGGVAEQEVGSRHQQKDDSKEEKNDNNCKETNSSSGIGEGNNMINKPNCTRQVSSDNVGISDRRLQDADGLQKKEESTSCDQQLPDAHQYNMASSPTYRQRNSEETIITPTSVRSITLAQLYHQSRRSRHSHSDHAHRRSSNDSISISSSILPPPPLVGGSSQEQEKIWSEMQTAISATNQEEWSFAPTLKTSTISQESHTFGCSSNSLASIEMDEYDTTCLDDDMTVDTVFEGDDVQLLAKKEEAPPAAL